MSNRFDMADLKFIYLILAVFSFHRGYGQVIDVRLVNGTKPNEGTIMYTEDCQIWKTSCGPTLGRAETNVICRHLGYAVTNWVVNNSSFGGPSPTSNITCTGDEKSVSNCSLAIGCANAEVGGAVCYENNYLGCFIDYIGDRALRGPANQTFSGLTIDKCLEFCRQYSEMVFAGVEYTWECFCGDATSDYSRHGRVPDNQCNSRCHGSQYERCGGSFRIAVFNLTTDPHLPSNPMGSPCNVTTPLASMTTTTVTQSTHQPTTLQETSSLSVVCPNTSWPSPYGIAQFPSGDLHSWSKSSGECPWFTVNDGEPIARAVCSGDYISPYAWVPSDNCGGNKTADQLLIYLRENLTTGESDIQDVLSVLTVISQDTNITSAGVGAAFDIIHQTGSISQPTQENVASVVDIVSNLAALDKGVTMDAEMMNGAVSRATMALENILLAVDVPSNQTFQQVAPNLVVQVINSESDGAGDGIVFSIIGDDSQSFDESDIQLSTNNLGKGNLGGVVQAAIIIGPETIDEGTMGNIAFTVYRDDALFVMDGGQDVQVGSNEGRRNITVNTNIIGASLGTSETKPLNDPVTITLAHKQGNATNPQCVYWEYSANAWSSDGCVLTITSETHTECQCNHLTSFAVLMDVSGIPRRSERVEQVFKILGYIGCSLSIVGLLVTLAVYITDRKLRCLQHIRILMCLCITLLFLYIFFIIMTALDRYHGEPEVGPGLCGVIAAVLHFTTLSSISWMGVEGINMYLMVVRVMDSYIPLFMMKASVIAWGIPAAIVLLTGAVSRQNYSNSDYCFLQKWPLVGGLLIPMAFILALNLIIFAVVMRRLARVKSGGGKASELKSEARHEITRRLTNGIGVLLLLGLTWLVGYFTVIKQLNLAVHVIFILLNSLQGFFIFVFYVLRQPQSRARLREHLVCCFHDSYSVTRSGPMSMKQTTKTVTDNPMSGYESVLSKSDID